MEHNDYIITNIDEFKMLMNEGLLLTHPMDITITWLEDYLRKYNNVFIQQINLKNKFKITFYDIIPFDSLQNIYNYIVNLYGWFPSYSIFYYINREKKDLTAHKMNNIDFIFLKENWNNFNSLEITFEAKFDFEIEFNKDDKIYHVSPLIYKEKILKMGLIPKTNSKLTYHPERIYFFNDINYTNFLISKLKDKNGEKYKNIISKYFKYEKVNEYVLYEIINLDKYKFYNDVNYNNKGVYTLENINPNDIKVMGV